MSNQKAWKNCSGNPIDITTLGELISGLTQCEEQEQKRNRHQVQTTQHLIKTKTPLHIQDLCDIVVSYLCIGENAPLLNVCIECTDILYLPKGFTIYERTTHEKKQELALTCEQMKTNKWIDLLTTSDLLKSCHQALKTWFTDSKGGQWKLSKEKETRFYIQDDEEEQEEESAVKLVVVESILEDTPEWKKRLVVLKLEKP